MDPKTACPPIIFPSPVMFTINNHTLVTMFPCNRTAGQNLGAPWDKGGDPTEHVKPEIRAVLLIRVSKISQAPFFFWSEKTQFSFYCVPPAHTHLTAATKCPVL